MSQRSISDLDPSDDTSWPTSPPNPLMGNSCPVCGTLDMDIGVGKDNPCSLEYFIDPAKQHHDLLFQWIEECALCKLVYDLNQYWSEQGDNTKAMKYVGYNYRHACGRNGSTPLYLKIVADWDSFLVQRMVHIVVRADPLSRSPIARMKHWVARCDINDAKCKVQETALPTRVLDVNDLQNIRLCETGGQPSAYTALSHCWGLPNKTFITTHDTIADMKAGFAIERAPATFRDAIPITRAVGIRLPWIDSLCIIKHDNADWSREAARMGSVYANAYLTIAAGNAKDDNDGFLQPRSDALTPLRIISSTGNSAQVYLQTQHDGIEVHAYYAKEPLDARGWALQEQGLATEVAKFEKGTYYAGLWWEDLASGMLWFRGRAAELNNPSEYLAPSWSWASLNGWTLVYEDPPANITLPDTIFRECHLEYESDDRHGAIKLGWLDLSAPAVKLVQGEAPVGCKVDDGGLDVALGFAHLDVPDNEIDDHGDEVERWPCRRSTKGNLETRGVFDLAHKDCTEILGLFLAFSHDKVGVEAEDRDKINRQNAQKDFLH